MVVFWPDDYLDQVARQVRVVRIREPLTAELKDHMLSQKADYMAAGLSEEEAERRTTEDMGDALLVGGELDAVHRPTTRWKGIAIATLLLALGLGYRRSMAWETVLFSYRLGERERDRQRRGDRRAAGRHR